MIMQNSYLRMANHTRTRQLNIVQGDKSLIKFQLLDRGQRVLSELDGQIAQVSIFESKNNALREFSESRIEDGIFTFNIENVLNEGKHEMRVKVGDYYFPSDEGTFTFNILPAHDINTEVDPTDIQTIDLVIDALADEIIDYFYPVLEQETQAYFEQNAPVFKGEAFTYEDFTPEQLEEISMSVAEESRDEDGNTLITFSDGTTVTIPKGDKGDKGDQGIQGIQGERGLTGDRGERGLTGLTGDKGEKGDALTFEELSPQQKEELRGEKGEKGEKGDKGDPLKYADLTPEQIEELQQEVDYSQVAKKEHTHDVSDIEGLNEELSTKADKTAHDALKTQVDEIADTEGNINAGTIPMSHTDGVATEATVRDSFNNLEDTFNQHTHTTADIDGLDDKLLDLENNSGAPEKHNHDIADVNGLQSNLDNKADKEHSHSVENVTGLREELDSKASTTDVDNIATELDSKAEVDHTHEDKADIVHTHTTADIEGLDAKLTDLENNSGGGIPAEHTHDISEVNGLQDELADKAIKGDIYAKDIWFNDMGTQDLQTKINLHSHWIRNDETEDHLRVQLENTSKPPSTPNKTNTKALIPYIQEEMIDKIELGNHTHEISNIDGLQDEIDNLKSSGVDAKTSISTAINSAGGEVDSADTFDVMAQAISGLSSGGGGAVQNIEIFQMNLRTGSGRHVDIQGLSFKPDEVLFFGNGGSGGFMRNFAANNVYNPAITVGGYLSRDGTDNFIVERHSRSATFSKSQISPVVFSDNSITFDYDLNLGNYIFIVYQKGKQLELNEIDESYQSYDSATSTHTVNLNDRVF